jgi:hypothetical protein
VRLHIDDIARMGEGTGWGCRRARSAVGGRGRGAGMREDREPAPPPGALAHPRMTTKTGAR